MPANANPIATLRIVSAGRAVVARVDIAERRTGDRECPAECERDPRAAVRSPDASTPATVA